MDQERRIIVALDGLNLEQSERIIKELAPHVGAFKVGFELITRQQAGLVADFAAREGADVFYDGKFHDIPKTVANASRIVAEMLSVTMFNVHCLGGYEMMQAARKSVDEKCFGGRRPLILGVTILTSHDYKSLVEIGLCSQLHPIEVGTVYIRELVASLAKLAQIAGLDGVVASPKEIGAIRKTCGPEFLIVTPGVRPAGTEVNDQKRVMTPREAIRCGADYLVIGRPITEAADPADAVKRIVDEITTASTPCPGRD